MGGWKVIGGLVQPSGDSYVSEKLGSDAIDLEDRITLCSIMAKEESSAALAPPWIGVWTGGQINGGCAARLAQEYLSDVLDEQLQGREIQHFMVCGADLIDRCGGSSLLRYPNAAGVHTVVIGRGGTDLDTSSVGTGWYVVNEERSVDAVAAGSTQEIALVSSTKIRTKIHQGRWAELLSDGWITVESERWKC